MLESFDGGHISIEATDEIEEEAEKLFSEKQLNKESDDEESQPELRNYKIAAQVAQKYIPEGKSIKNGNLRWGKLKSDIGYHQMIQMMGMADYGISDSLSFRY